MWLRKPWVAIIIGILALVMVGCGGQSSQETVEPDSLSEEDFVPIVSATGEVVPAQWAALSFPISGPVVLLAVEEGDEVSAGDVLAELDTAGLDATVAEAEAGLTVAEANLARTQAGPREEEIGQAENQLEAAQAALAEVAALRDDLLDGASGAEIAAAQADLLAAQTAQRQAQEGYDFLLGLAEVWPDDTEPGDWTPLNSERSAREALNLANQQLAVAQAYVDELTGDPDPNQLQIAEAQVWAAAARRDATQAQLALLQAGPSPEEIAIAEAQVAQAQAALMAAQATRAQATLVAPFDGVVSTLDVRQNEWVAPGQRVLLLADLSGLRVETTDLNEIDVARIGVGASAAITFDALPDLQVQGTVMSVAPMAAQGAGVNYTVIIELDEIPEGLRWGMTAFVDIQVEQ